jgi:uncharacterized protein (DUF1697 family)
MKNEKIKYIALLRGINVGGKNVIKMEDLRQLFESLGFENVKTYIQSGNVYFESADKNESALTKKIEMQLRKTLNDDVLVFIRTIAEVKAIVNLFPFNKIKTAPGTKFYVSFLKDELKKKPKLPHISPKKDVEIIEIKKREIYCLTVEINGRFGFPNNFVENEFNIAATTRNWLTVCALLKLTDSKS